MRSEGAITPDRARATLARLRLSAILGADNVDPRVGADLPMDFERPRGFRGATDGGDDGKDGEKDDE